MSILGSLELALVLGLRHALEADHVAAVGTLIEPSIDARAVAATAARWGLGHAFTLITLGTALLALGLHLPARLEVAAELGVAGLLIVLGAWRLVPHAAASARLHRGAFAVGVLHGLAGSGPLILLAMSTLEQKPYALLYLLLVAVGALLGMVAIAGLFALPLARVAAKRRAVQRAIEIVAGVASIGAGLRLGMALL
jgi:nickel/cobalt transporter (NicO) family protein